MGSAFFLLALCVLVTSVNMSLHCDIVHVDTDFPQSSLCFALEELYFLEYAAPTSPPRAGIPNLGISLRKIIQQNESWHHGWVREADRLPIQHWLDRGETVQLMPLRFCARFPGTDSWGNRAVWRNGRAAWWVRNNGNKRKREPVIRDHATEDEDEEERREGR
ncbi:hypothetical protein V8E54_013744 [Elaphomyces granulatus]